MRVLFLGSSTSYGVPVIGCRCPTCISTDPRNKRTRASLYVETDEGVRLLIDSGPELRLQALREGVTRLDAVLYTHFHADHTAGIDDLKAFNAAGFCRASAMRRLEHRCANALPMLSWARHGLD
jgi:phosphoribosyl 1,2-cyclic phosphate phosphodiesterase